MGEVRVMGEAFIIDTETTRQIKVTNGFARCDLQLTAFGHSIYNNPFTSLEEGRENASTDVFAFDQTDCGSRMFRLRI